MQVTYNEKQTTLQDINIPGGHATQLLTDCLPVCPSHLSVMTKWLKTSKYALHHTTELCL